MRSWVLGLVGARVGQAPGDAYTRRYYRKLNRYSANLALMADISMMTLGGKLKFKESLSGRLGDVPGYATVNLRTGYQMGKEAHNLRLAA